MATMTLTALSEHVAKSLDAVVGRAEVERSGELVIHAVTNGIAKLIGFLKSDPDCRFDQLIDICGVDFPERELRFDIVYNLLSVAHNQRARVIITADEDTAVPSVASLFPAANWFEREVWDLYGVFFADHPDLRRILTDYGFEGHPLRKDFPLTGFVELRYDEAQKRVVYEPVTLTQDFRRFEYTSPWEGMTSIQLPGDEKAVKPPHA